MKKEKEKSEKQITLFQALIPVILLTGLTSYAFIFRDDALSGTNQYILLIGGTVAIIVGLYNRVSYDNVILQITNNIRDTSNAILYFCW